MRVSLIDWLIVFSCWKWKERKRERWPHSSGQRQRRLLVNENSIYFIISVFQFQRLSSALTASLIWDSLRGEDIAGWGGTILGFLLHKWEIAKDIFDKILLMLLTLWVKGARGSQKEYTPNNFSQSIVVSFDNIQHYIGESDRRRFCTLLHWSLAANYLTRNCCPHQSSDKEIK